MHAAKPKSRWIMPPRFLLFLGLLALAATATWPLVVHRGQALLAGFDVAAIAFILSLIPLSHDHTPAQMRAHAKTNDAGRIGVLVITGLLMLVIVTGVAIELPDARHDTGPAHIWGMVLVLGSLVVAWAFSNLVYALHYAHMYYRENGESGLNFPEHRDAPRHHDPCPNFWDFVYFSLTVGMAFATSDVEITRSDIRRIVALHGVAAFFYNLIVLAFTINVTAGG